MNPMKSSYTSVVIHSDLVFNGVSNKKFPDVCMWYKQIQGFSAFQNNTEEQNFHYPSFKRPNEELNEENW
mgnify:FL=1